MRTPDRFTDEERERINRVAISFIGRQIDKKHVIRLQKEFKRHTVGSISFMLYKNRVNAVKGVETRMESNCAYQPTSLDDLKASVEKIQWDFNKLKTENEELREIKNLMETYARRVK